MKPPAILIDLDDTLLEVQLDHFIQAYFQSLSDHVASYGVGNGFVKVLGEGTRKMLHNEDPTITLEEAFAEYFYPAINAFLPQQLKSSHHDPSQNPHPLYPIFMEFYEQVFPRLEKITRRKEESRELVDNLIKKGYTVAIATNPLFPQTATYQRLRWAGLAPEKYPFKVITTYEDFHFTKPKLEYYAEVLAHLGWEMDGAVMVGNNLIDDIDPAQRLGMATFWMNTNGKDLKTPSFRVHYTAPNGEGSLSEVLAWLQSLDYSKLKLNISQLEAAKAVLKSTAALMDTWRRKNFPVNQWLQKRRLEEWSPLEVLYHLVDVESEVYLPRIWKIISEESPYIKNVDASGWSVERHYQEKDLTEGISAFIEKG
jgi:FMN phosphatase YigB (HAD superfamily)